MGKGPCMSCGGEKAEPAPEECLHSRNHFVFRGANGDLWGTFRLIESVLPLSHEEIKDRARAFAGREKAERDLRSWWGSEFSPRVTHAEHLKRTDPELFEILHRLLTGRNG